MIIVCPTQQLAIQIHDIVVKLTNGCAFFKACLLIGGGKVAAEKKTLRKGANMVIGTLGKLEYHYRNTKNFSLQDLQWVVFEELTGGRVFEDYEVAYRL